MLAALAGFVHDRQGADGQQRNCGADNCQGGPHRDLAVVGPPDKSSFFKMKPRRTRDCYRKEKSALRDHAVLPLSVSSAAACTL